MTDRRDTARPLVRPTDTQEAANTFEMCQGLTGWSWHHHPDITGLRVDCYPTPSELSPESMPVAGLKVYLPIGEQEVIFSFDDIPVGEWSQLSGPDGSPLPIEVYVDGSVRVIGRWC